MKRASRRHRDAGPEDDQDTPSKSARKRQMTALQSLGEALTTLSDRQLQKIPLDDERLALAVREARGIRQHSARRRQLQYIGKLMRNVDVAPVAEAFAALDSPPPAARKLFGYWLEVSASSTGAEDDGDEP